MFNRLILASSHKFTWHNYKIYIEDSAIFMAKDFINIIYTNSRTKYHETELVCDEVRCTALCYRQICAQDNIQVSVTGNNV